MPCSAIFYFLRARVCNTKLQVYTNGLSCFQEAYKASLNRGAFFQSSHENRVKNFFC